MAMFCQLGLFSLKPESSTVVETPNRNMSALELCADELMVGGGGVGGIRPDERALKQRTRWTIVFFWFHRGHSLHL